MKNSEKAYAIDSWGIGVLVNLASAYSVIGIKRDAIQYLEKSIEIDSIFYHISLN